MIPIEDYNNLPTVGEAHISAEGLTSVKQRLIDIVTRHGLADKFGIRLIHKHFDMNDGEVPVFRDIDVQGVCTAIFMGPVRDNNLGPVFGKNFLLDREGAVVPFEYTTSPCEAPSEYPGFVEEVAHELLMSNAAKHLGLCIHPKGSEEYTEFELPELRSTVMIPERLMPTDYGDAPLVTNWAAEIFPAPVDSCTQTRSGKHYGNCLATRSGKHYAREQFGNGADKQSEWVPSAFDKAMKNTSSDLYKVVQTVTATV